MRLSLAPLATISSPRMLAARPAVVVAVPGALFRSAFGLPRRSALPISSVMSAANICLRSRSSVATRRKPGGAICQRRACPRLLRVEGLL